MLRKLLIFALLALALLVAKAPARLVDGLVARATDGGLRLQQAEGSLWHGRGVLASRDAGGRSLTPWLPLAWDLDTAALGRLALGWTFSSSGSPLGAVEASPGGVSVRRLALHAPADTALASIPHPAARAGWQGDLTVEAPDWHCPPTAAAPATPACCGAAPAARSSQAASLATTSCASSPAPAT